VERAAWRIRREGHQIEAHAAEDLLAYGEHLDPLGIPVGLRADGALVGNRNVPDRHALAKA